MTNTAVLICLTASLAWGQRIITTVAGTDFTFPATPIAAKDAPLGSVSGDLVVDTRGNVYFADYNNNRVMKVDPLGVLTVIAGNGVQGYSGDGGPASNASLNGPVSVALDQAGNIFFGERGNTRIRKITPDGTISTAVGLAFLNNGLFLASLAVVGSLAVDTAGNLLFSEPAGGQVRKLSTDGTVSTIASSLFNPLGLAVDPSGNIYVALGDRVQKITAGGTIDNFWSVSCLFIALDSAGNLLCSSNTNSIGQVLKRSPSGQVTTAASVNGTFLSGLASDATGALVVGSTPIPRVLRVAPNGNISTLAGNGGFRFSGDGGLAVNASLNQPNAVTLDGLGNLFIADRVGSRIRKVTPDGKITTVAGNGGTQFLAGDGGLAVNASIYDLNTVFADALGNLFFSDSYTIRKVTPNGLVSTVGSLWDLTLEESQQFTVDRTGVIYVISRNQVFRYPADGFRTLVAGTGVAGFSGDGGPATSATLSRPTGLAVDAAGNLFIADSSNNRVRKVDRSGAITTVAGNGTGFRQTGDEGPAVQAALGGPESLAVDDNGSLYISAPGSGPNPNNMIRVVTPDGIIHALAGNTGSCNGNGLGDGQAAVLAGPCFQQMAVDRSGAVFIADPVNRRVRKVLVSPPALTAAPLSFSFSGQSGGAHSDPKGLTVSTAVSGMDFAVSTSAPWLSADVSSGSTPRLIQITADPFSLDPGSYSGTVTIRASLASPGLVTIPVSFSVGPGLPPALSVQDSLSFTYPAGAPPQTQSVPMRNMGGGVLGVQVSVDQPWLSITPGGGSITPSQPLTLSVTADPTLSPGTYSGQVQITSTSDSNTRNIPVIMTISDNPSTLLLSQTGLTLTAIERGGIVPPQSFGVIQLGAGSPSFSIDTSTTQGGQWLSAAVSGQSIKVSVDTSRLAANRYYGLVNVLSGSPNSPQAVTTLLNVLPAGTDLGAVLLPNELTFNTVRGTVSPGSQTVLIYNLTAQPKSFTASAADSHVVILPARATALPNQPATMVVQPFISDLAAGAYRSPVTLQFDDGRVLTISLTVVVSERSAGDSARSGRNAATDCQPSILFPAITSLGGGFAVPAGWPVAIQTLVQDDCGAPLESGSVFAEFSNGDPPIALLSLTGGRWDGTWQPRANSQGVTVTIRALNNTKQLAGSRQVAGAFANNLQPPIIAEGGIANAAGKSPFQPLTPGGLITISGSQLSDQSAQASTVPFGSTLGNTRVLIAGQSLPIAVTDSKTDPNKVTAIIPYGISVNTQHQILLQRANTISLPVSVNVAAASPAIFTTDGTQGMIVDANGKAISAGNPARSGDVITVYCTGLGELRQTVTAGDYGPAASDTKTPVSLSIGGLEAGIQFSGLAPQLVGVYFVQTTIPNGVVPGDQVPVTLSSSTTPPAVSPTVTIAIAN